MPVGIKSVIQDTEGYLWIASAQGLDRFDGLEVRPWGRDQVSTQLEWLSVGPQGQIAAAHESIPAWEVAGDSLRAVAGPDGQVVPNVRHVGYDANSRLWMISAERLMAREANGAWLSDTVVSLPDERALWLGSSSMVDGVVVSTREGNLYRIVPPGPPRRIAALSAGYFTRMHILDAGSLLATFRFGPHAGLYLVDAAGTHLLLPIPDGARPTGLVQRGSISWLSMDQGIFAVDQSGHVETLRSSDGFEGGGGLFVDREGSLWLTSYRGELRQFPEPDARWWTLRSGLGDSRARGVIRMPAGVWVGTWSGPYLRDERADAWTRIDTGRLFLPDTGCVDPSGAVWAGGWAWRDDGKTHDVLARFKDGRWTEALWRPRFDGGDVECATTPSGRFSVVFGSWFLDIASADGAIRRTVPIPRGEAAPVGLELEPAPVVILMDGRVCREASEATASGGWRCTAELPAGIMDALQMGDGRTWLATEHSGVLGWDGATVSPVLPPEQLGFTQVVRLASTASAGVWVLGGSERVRAVPAGTGARVVESLGETSGVSSWSGSGFMEDPDGTLWIATLAGVVQVPPHARGERSESPDVLVTSLLVDGRSNPTDADLQIPAERNRIDVSWSSRSYRDPRRLRYRYRLSESDPWAAAAQPRLRFAQLGAGSYRLELAASLDGQSWSAVPAVVQFHVLAPWYLRWWAMAMAVVIASLSAFLAHRIRVRHLTRLERQRAEIAMDLHDRMGSGLASIGLMADMVATPEMADAERTALAERLISSSRRLGGEVADIVWSLRPGLDSLEAFVLFLKTRAREMAAERTTAIQFSVPDPMPHVTLSLPVRRHLQWMAIEAIQNSVKHAHPAHIEIVVRPEGPRWRLEVRDDGTGFDPGQVARGSGFGQESLRRRAVEIGASIQVASAPGRGTQVVILFDPRGGRRAADRHNPETPS